jgi:hypothetical protein
MWNILQRLGLGASLYEQLEIQEIENWVVYQLSGPSPLDMANPNGFTIPINSTDTLPGAAGTWP